MAEFGQGFFNIRKDMREIWRFFQTADCADYQQTTDLTDYTELLMRKRINFTDWLPQALA
ncbi:MAG: hypothetical protein MJZ94_11885 [Bacteroidales bacterium]|nr:hypothetical protein [Bacteroidales bacterium]